MYLSETTLDWYKIERLTKFTNPNSPATVVQKREREAIGFSEDLEGGRSVLQLNLNPSSAATAAALV